MDIRYVKDLISQAFNKDGLKIKDYTVTCKSPLTAHLYGGDGTVHLMFAGHRPVLSITKIITFSVELEELYLNNEGGKIKLKNFPDINFALEDMSDVRCGSCCSDQIIGQTDLYDDIESHFGDEESRRLAGKALQYAQAWATMTMDGGTCFNSMSSSDVKTMKRECRAFVKERMKEERHGSIIVVLLVQMLLPYIIKWIVERVIDRIING